MSDIEQDDIDRINNLMSELLASERHRPRAIHEAGHAVVALHLSLPLESVNIQEREEPDGPRFGCVKVKAISEDFSADELRDHSPRVVERVRHQLIMLLAGEAATMLILERARDPLAQIDQSQIRSALREFREFQGGAVMEELTTEAREIVSTRRADIEKLAAALVKGVSLNRDEVLKILEE
jgi:hypothetical protein